MKSIPFNIKNYMAVLTLGLGKHVVEQNGTNYITSLTLAVKGNFR